MSRSNILMILVDEMRADSLGCFGSHLARTPNLDRLAARGVRFDRCMITQPTCTPSRASLLTGCFPSALRSRMVGCVTPDDPRFLPSVLRRNGYRTASIGKIHLVPQAWEAREIEKTRGSDGTFDYYGFQHVELVNGHGDRCFGPRYTPWVRERVSDLDARLRERRRLCAVEDCYEWPLPPETHSGRYIAEHASEFIDGAAERDEPFFLHCSFPDPHHPFTAPEPYASMFSPRDVAAPLPPISESVDPHPAGLDAYYGCVRPLPDSDGSPVDRLIGTPPRPYSSYSPEDWRVVRAMTAGMVSLLDECIGVVMDSLERNRLTDDTIVVFASDHGDYLGDYGLFGKGLHYDCVLRTPLLMSGPGIPGGTVIGGPTSIVDVMPTLLELVGIEEPVAAQGVSMAAGMADQEALPRRAALTENDDDMAGLRMRTLTTADWRITVCAGSNFGELYDLRGDPGERVNLWNDPAHSAAKADLMRQLCDHMLCAIDGSNGRVQRPAPAVTKHVPVKSFNCAGGG